jgi:DNA repair protein RadD
MRVAGERCRSCGFLPAPPPRAIDFTDGDLARIDRNGAHQLVYSQADKLRWLSELTFIGQQRGYKPGWVAHKFKEKFGNWPPRGIQPRVQPASPEVSSWVRSRQIAYAKAKQSAA